MFFNFYNNVGDIVQSNNKHMKEVLFEIQNRLKIYESNSNKLSAKKLK